MFNNEKIDPKVDYAFKRILATDDNIDILTDFVNSVVDPIDRVSSVEICTPITVPVTPWDTACVLDILARGVNGNLFNIEMQVRNQRSYAKRSLLYWAKTYVDQLLGKKNYNQLFKTLGIHILGFEMFPKLSNYHNVHEITTRGTAGEHIFSEMLQIHTIELPKFSREKDDYCKVLSKIHSELDMWSLFFVHYNKINENNIPQEYSNAPIKKAIQVLDIISKSDKERELYNRSLEKDRKYISDLSEEREEGEKTGEAKGEAKTKVSLALKFLKEGASLEMIENCTDLSIKQVNQLKQALDCDLKDLEDVKGSIVEELILRNF